MLGLDQAVDLLGSTVVASIGPVTAEAAQQLDIATNVMPRALHDPGSRRRARRAFCGAAATAAVAGSTNATTRQASRMLTALERLRLSRLRRLRSRSARPAPPAAAAAALARAPRAGARDAAEPRHVPLSAVRVHRAGPAARSRVDAGRVSAVGRRSREGSRGGEGRRGAGRAAVRAAGQQGRDRLGGLGLPTRRCNRPSAR